MLHIKVADASLKGNKLYLCANDRVVMDLDLDNHVDMNRASFDISDSKEDEDTSIDEITSRVRVEIEEFLKEYLDEVRKKKDEYIRKYISNNAPQFMYLLKYMPDSIQKIKPGLTEEKLS